MPHVGVLFEIRAAETRPGEFVSIVGSRPELGSWDPFDYKAAKELHLRTGDSQYPSWAMAVPVWIKLPEGIEGGSQLDESGSSEVHGSEVSSPAGHLQISREISLQDSSSWDTVGEAVSFDGDSFVLLEYKYLKDRRQLKDFPSIQWEDSIANRKIKLPAEPGSIWIVTDARFNESSDPMLTRTSLAEVLSRRENTDPEWTSWQKELDLPGPESAMPHYEEISSSSPGSAYTNCSHHTTSTICRF